MKYVIFRYDRIGDFLLSSILLNNIKNQNNNIQFIIVCSEKNYNYIKKSFLVDTVMVIPNNFYKRIKFYFEIFGFKCSKAIVLDGKKKSILSAILLRCDNKILLTNKNLYKSLFKPFFKKIFFSNDKNSKIDELISISSYLNFDFKISSAKYKNELNIDKNMEKIINEIINFNLFHFDEKWILSDYIKNYENIEPNNIQLINFINSLVVNTNNNLIITTGLKNNHLISFLKSIFKRINDNTFSYIYEKKIIFLFEKIDIFNLEYIISKSSNIITCHGAPSHLSNMYDKNLIDVIDKSEDQVFKNWTSHFTNYKSFYREDFAHLSLKIIDELKN